MNTKRPLLSEITLTKSKSADLESLSGVEIPRPAGEADVTVKALSVRVRDDAWRQLRELTLRETTAGQRVTAQSLIVEALNLLFKDRHLPEIAAAPPEGSASRKPAA